jgi:hypothetical protein
MNDPQPRPASETGSDLEYDLAHDDAGAATPVPTSGQAQRDAVPTATPEYDGDYTYDLAHDIPGR